MTATLGLLDLETAAKEAAGTGEHFDCFCWHRKTDLERPEEWAIFYTHHRDSDLLDQSNAEVIAETMEKFTTGDNPDVVFESHFHWASATSMGSLFGSIGVAESLGPFGPTTSFDNGSPNTRCWTKSDYSAREYETTIKNIADAAWRVKREHELPRGWEAQVYRWLSDHEEDEIENRDDRGGYPSEDSLRRAFAALEFKKSE